jgi:putative ABC transport system substrate-binding protein
MRRRQFITLLGGAAVTWPVVAQGQSRPPVIGLLEPRSPDAITDRIGALREGLKEGGFIEGENVAIEYRWAEGQYERLPHLAADLVSRNVNVIVAAYFPSTLAAKAATSTIPIVFISGVDPIAAGLVTSLSRPGGNLTGLSNFNTRLMGKRLELLHQVAPRSAIMAVLVNSKKSGDADH